MAVTSELFGSMAQTERTESAEGSQHDADELRVFEGSRFRVLDAAGGSANGLEASSESFGTTLVGGSVNEQEPHQLRSVRAVGTGSGSPLSAVSGTSPAAASPNSVDSSHSGRGNMSAAAEVGDDAERRRRRNTEASARFRVRRKMREESMNKRHSELTDRISQLQMRIKSLEMENQCLKKMLLDSDGTALSSLNNYQLLGLIKKSSESFKVTSI